jgi:hypothetical protein
MEPTTDGALTISIDAYTVIPRPAFVSRYEDKTLNIPCPFLVSNSSLQQKRFLELPSFTNYRNATTKVDW